VKLAYSPNWAAPLTARAFNELGMYAKSLIRGPTVMKNVPFFPSGGGKRDPFCW